MEFINKDYVIKAVRHITAEYLTGERVFYSDKDDILFDINKTIIAEIEKLPKTKTLEGEYTGAKNDLVSREAVIDLYKKYRPRLATQVLEFGDELEELPPVRICPYLDQEIGCCRKSEVPKAEWVPVSERLPEMDESVLICTDKGEMTVAYHTFKEWSEKEMEWFVFGVLGYALTYQDEEVLAWMPLPEPYKGEEA